jgi:hypothetical protein
LLNPYADLKAVVAVPAPRQFDPSVAHDSNFVGLGLNDLFGELSDFRNLLAERSERAFRWRRDDGDEEVSELDIAERRIRWS